ncbi:MAG: RluA family pseudouridine synthase [Acidimicrobiales bacterium]
MSDANQPDLFDGETLELFVPATLEGMRVDRVISMLTGRSRAEAVEAIEKGRVRVNDKVVTKASQQLARDQLLVAQLRTATHGALQPDASVDVDVVLEDADFVVVNKTPHQVVHPGAGQREGTLAAGLLARYPEIARLSELGLSDAERPGIVHRLDKGTSGLLVVARSPEGLESLASQMAQREVARTYLSLVRGHVIEERGIVDAAIGRSTRNPTQMALRSDGRPARTHYEVLERLDDPYESTLLRLRLETGRTHQIRVHLASIDHPVVNDLRYGHRRDERLDEQRLFLHAAALSFRHPRTDEVVSVAAPLPNDLRELLPDGIEL